MPNVANIMTTSRNHLRDSIIEGTKEVGVVDQQPKLEGRRMVFVLRPIAATKK